MGQKRKFSFRIPWISSASAPKDESKSSKHPHSTISIQGFPKKDVQQQSPPHSPQPVTSSDVPISTSPQSGTPIQFNSSPSSSSSPSPSPPRVASKSQASPVSLSPTSSNKPDSKPGSPSHSPSKRNNEVLKPKAEGSTQLQQSSPSHSALERDKVLKPRTDEGTGPSSPSHLPSEHTSKVLNSTAEQSTQSASPISNTQPASQPQSPSLLASKPTSEVLNPIAEKSTQLQSPISNTQPASQPQSPSLLASKTTSEVLKPIAEKSPQLQSPISNTQPASQPQSPSLLASKTTSEVLKPIAEKSTQLQSPISNTQPASQPQSPSLLASKTASEVLKPVAEKNTQLQSPISNTQLASQPRSPSHLASKPTSEVSKVTAEERVQLASPISNTQPASQPSKPTSEVLKSTAEESTQLASQMSNTQSASPSRLASKPSSEVLKPVAEEITKPASFVSQQQKEKMTLFEPVSQESEPKMKSPLKAIPKAQEHSQPETSSQPERMSTQLTRMPRDEETSAPNRNSKSPLDSQSKFRKSEKKEKVVPKPIKEAKAKDPTSSQPIRRRTTKLHTTASTSGTKSNPISRAFQSDKKAEETTERKLLFSTSNPSGNDLKVVSSTEPTNKNISTISLRKDIREEVSKFVQKLATEHPKQDMDDDKSVSIITIAGDNRGTTMHIGSESSKKEESVYIHRAYKTNQKGSPEVTTEDEEESSEEESGNEKDEVGKSYINSNVQSINNSLMFHGSITERDPGVQLILPQNEPQNAEKPDEKPVLVTRKLTYQPTVRRRCLRGLFLEPSDSDPDNPEKPRRHGCKFSCGGTKTNQDMEIL